MTARRTFFLPILLTMLVTLVGCNFPTQPTPQPPGPATQAARTVDVILTQAARGTQPALTMTPTASSIALPQETVTTASPSTCQDRATFVQDATIPDDTILKPGDAFLKVWTLRNSGTCTWTQEYKLAFFGGERMNGLAEISMLNSISPGAAIDLAIDLIAPTTPGTYQGFWRLRNAQGAYFGIGPGGDQSFWVKILVRGPSTTTSTPSVTPTITPSMTPSPIATTSPAATSSPTSTATLTATATASETATATPTDTVTTTAAPIKTTEE